MNWNDTLRERATIEHCRELHYDREVEDITTECEDEEDNEEEDEEDGGAE